MPIYTLKCVKCEKIVEEVYKMNEEIPNCECGGKREKCVENFTFNLIGSWAKQKYS